ncbi:MAG TPA: protein kinase [Verrucomicrobiae bacterium]|nr:protein kinase [Verrucomicrobiae bacterium]
MSPAFRHPDYELGEELGRGGFGVVYLARRKGMQDCAVKLFYPDRVDLVRVARELEKLQRVREHRGVVTVYDFDLGGASPFYAMGLHAERGSDGRLWGRTLEGRCGRVSEREAWRLIGEVAAALAYLHEHEVIHCDVKPGNVLLTDERPAGVKVCDFGQSRGSVGQWAERVGTVTYAAPEQLARPGESGGGSGYRWDVYGFGVLAFELLTGRLPRLETWASGAAEQLATLRQSMGEETATARWIELVVEAVRRAGPVNWPAGVKGDREKRAVIVRCMAIEPEKRYGDMRAVVEALEAVDTRRALRRNRRVLGMVGAMAIVAMAAAGLAGWLWREAEEAKRRIATERDRADKARVQAEGLVDFMTFDLRDKLRPIGRLDLMEDLIRRVEAYHRQREEDEAAGKEARSVEELRRRSVNFDTQGNTWSALGNLGEALASYRRSLEMREVLAARDPTNAELQRDLSVSLDKVGDVRKTQGDPDGALDSYRRSLEIRERLAQQEPGNPEWRRNLSVSFANVGDVLKARGDLDGALANARRFLEGAENLVRGDPDNAAWRRDLVVGLNMVGDVRQAEGDLDGALANHQRALAEAERLAGQDPKNADWKRDLALSLDRVGDVRKAQGDADGALDNWRRSLEITEGLASQDPKNTGWQRDLLVGLNKVGDVHQDRGAFDAALASYGQSLKIAEALAAQNPDNINWRRDLAVGLNKSGAAQHARGHLDEAVGSYRRSLEIREKLARQDSDNAEWQRDVFVGLANLAHVELQRGNRPAAKAYLIRGEAIIARLVATAPKHAQWQEDLREVRRRLADLE